MISPELLRRYPFFGQFKNGQLDVLAMLGEQINFDDDQLIFEQGKPASSLFFLLDGCIDLYYTIPDNTLPGGQKEIPVCEINVGEPFGISTLIEPNTLTSTARSRGNSRALSFSGDGLKKIMQEDPALELVMLRRISHTAIERLYATRTQLAAAIT